MERARKMRRVVRPSRSGIVVVGIDPGLKGALVALSPPGDLVAYHDTPLVSKKVYDVRRMTWMLREINPRWVFIEASAPRPGIQSAASMWSTGYSFGLWEGIIGSLGVPYELARPQAWMRQMHKGTKAEDTKDRSMTACRRLLPDLPIFGPKGGKLDGRADAGLIALYGIRQLGVL